METPLKVLLNRCWSSNFSTILIILFGVLWMYYLYKCRMRGLTKKLESFNSIPTVPLIGNLNILSGTKKERAIKWYKLVTEHETPLVFWLLHKPIFILGRSQDIQVVLNRTQERDLLGMFEMVFGDSITGLQGEKWRKHRRIVTSAFSPKMLQAYLKIFNKYSFLLTNDLKKFADNDNAIDTWNHVNHVNSLSITQNITGHKVEIGDRSIDEFTEAYSKSLGIETSRFTSPVLLPKLIYKLYLVISGKIEIFKTMRRFPRHIVKERLSEYEKKLQENEQREETDNSKTLIDSLLNAHIADAEFTEKHVSAEIANLIILGNDSTSTTINFVLLMMAMYPNIQERVYEEIKTVLGNSDREVETEDIRKFVYLERCIKETLRKFTVLPITFRRHNEDITLNDGRIIPANHTMLIAFYAAHHDRKVFPNPEKWDPEHFAPNNITTQREVFFPFGAGLRSCVGATYAMMSMKTQLVYLLRCYRFTTNMKMNDLKLTFLPGLRNTTGFWMKLWSRDT
uniref:Cytochrome P450 3638E1 n=1 Tax=Maconellicoccus hirsutus TaxID=177089 RepID=A0AAT9UTW5_MACHI